MGDSLYGAGGEIVPQSVVERGTLLPQNCAFSIGYSADRRRTHEPSNNQLAAAIADLHASDPAWGERSYQWRGYGAATSRIRVSIRSAIL